MRRHRKAWPIVLKMQASSYKPEMFSVFKEENDRIWKKIEQGILTMDDLPYVRWQAILKKLGLEADGVAMEMLFRKCLFYSAVPMEGAKEILDHLQGKVYPVHGQQRPL